MLPVCRGYSFTFSAFQCVSNDTCKPENTAFLLLGLFAYWIVFILVLFVILSLKLSIGSGFMYGIVYFFSIASLYVRSSELYNALATVSNVYKCGYHSVRSWISWICKLECML